MRRVDALVIGGGPAGSTCAGTLHRAGWNVLVMDRARFPRDKVCAGWLTPEVFAGLELDPSAYRAAGHTLQEISAFRTGVLGGALLETRYESVISYAIRRCEFDAFLLRRTGVPVLQGTAARSIRRGAGAWVVNEDIETPILVGAGGHFCPVARHVSAGAAGPRPVVAREIEFRVSRGGQHRLPRDPELFFCADLEGYAWCVPKGEYLNVGIGRRESRGFAGHVQDFVRLLESRYGAGLAPPAAWKGHAYLASGAGGRPIVDDGMLLVGDAAGLAYPESGEGIRPAVESGRLAAETLIAAGGRLDRDSLSPYASAIRGRYPAAYRTPLLLRPAVAALGRLLLRSRGFTRHLVLDRWFLRAAV